MSCEFISDISVNSHSPILDMSLNDVSAQGFRKRALCWRRRAYPNNGGPPLISFEYAEGTLPFCTPDTGMLLILELDSFAAFRFWCRTSGRRLELLPVPAAGFQEDVPFWRALCDLSKLLIRYGCTGHTVIEINAQKSSIRQGVHIDEVPFRLFDFFALKS